MLAIQLYSIIQEYFGQMGVKDKEADNIPYEEMYDDEYIEHLESICDQLFIDCDLESDNIDILCDKVWKTQYEIEEKIKEELKKIEVKE